MPAQAEASPPPWAAPSCAPSPWARASVPPSRTSERPIVISPPRILPIPNIGGRSRRGGRGGERGGCGRAEGESDDDDDDDASEGRSGVEAWDRCAGSGPRTGPRTELGRSSSTEPRELAKDSIISSAWYGGSTEMVNLPRSFREWMRVAIPCISDGPGRDRITARIPARGAGGRTIPGLDSGIRSGAPALASGWERPRPELPGESGRLPRRGSGASLERERQETRETGEPAARRSMGRIGTGAGSNAIETRTRRNVAIRERASKTSISEQAERE